MKCHELEQWLADYFAEDLTISQVDELMEHLGSCKACRAEVRGVSAAGGAA